MFGNLTKPIASKHPIHAFSSGTVSSFHSGSGLSWMRCCAYKFVWRQIPDFLWEYQLKEFLNFFRRSESFGGSWLLTKLSYRDLLLSTSPFNFVIIPLLFFIILFCFFFISFFIVIFINIIWDITIWRALASTPPLLLGAVERIVQVVFACVEVEILKS